MRIQHNIVTVNAYRNYNTNTSALGKNLEKLSSGYKINRAGDDAAGLAISEKMRAQITGLNAAQNRLEHTANNLSVMAENIQDAESTIRDTDVAEEMMAYTKNNILVQSAQAMLAQANAVPQGALQLLS